MTKFLLSAAAILVASGAASAIPTKLFKWDGSLAIPDGSGTAANPANAQAVIVVPADPDGENIIGDLDIDMIIQHTWQGDLRIEITGPSGQSVVLLNRAGTTSAFGSPFGTSNDNFGNPTTGTKFLFDDAATQQYGLPTGTNVAAANNISGSFRPENPLSVFNGLSKVGTWAFKVTDEGAGDTGFIRNFGLRFTNIPAPGAVAVFGLAGLVAGRRRR